MKIKQPKNSLIAIMVLINIAVTLIVLFKDSDTQLEQTVRAQGLDSDMQQANRKKDDEISPQAVEEAEEEILFDIEGVTSHESELPTMPLYYHHSNEEGAWFTYKPVEEGEEWEGGYWFVDNQTLKEANIQYLMKNDIVQAVFYDGEYFEIKEVWLD